MSSSVEVEFSSNMEQVKTQINNMCVEKVTGATIHLQNQVKKILQVVVVVNNTKYHIQAVNIQHPNQAKLLLFVLVTY